MHRVGVHFPRPVPDRASNLLPAEAVMSGEPSILGGNNSVLKVR